MSTPLPTAHVGGATTPVVTTTPVVLPSPDRTVDLALRVSAPVSGENLPIILISHGHGPSNYVSSFYGYGPLVDYYASRGFVVIQPTHLDSATLGLREADHADAPLYWRQRALDMTLILDQLEAVEAAVPHVRGRLDRKKIAVVGHSMGGHTAGLLLGARLTDPDTGLEVDVSEPRIRAGVMLSAPGRGGDALSDYAAEHYQFFANPDFSKMSTPTLVVAGENDDVQYLSTAGPSWFTDPYHLSPSPKSLLTVVGAEHGLGGVAGYDLKETTDENPFAVAMVQRITWAFLRSQMDQDDAVWEEAKASLAGEENALGRVESK
ncbi:alpha/beta hydrolase [Blastococcus sp. CT_GayMR16]|uniref:alpha/beta hydrolase family protein n=1 Tax=Blastococcus sp. CT_GayMR16 TaxID=2559607 RepID=UPI001074988A|nr:alpha/beta hydrolase [Blastococcus sp. CT_GayMR16]TFV85652.1 alpha/beta hydrolase [Blastococcus sp. CT_GayMR16]